MPIIEGPLVRWHYVLICLILALAGAGLVRWGWGPARPSANFPEQEVHRRFEAARSPEFTSQEQPYTPSPDDWFRERTAESGIDFRHVSGDSDEKPFPAANGSGVAALDYDGDGNCDLYFATGAPIPVAVTPQSPTNRLYRNRGGWRFTDVTAESRLGLQSYSAGIAVGDYDSDGFPDVYVNCYGANQLFRNLGDGTFERVSPAAGVADERWGTSAAFLDCDSDGLIDLYVCNYGVWSPELNPYCGDRNRGVRLFCSPTSISGDRNALFRNTGDGTFADISLPSGIGLIPRRSQGVVAADLDGNGETDLYVANDLHPNSLFLNEGGGRFRDVSESSGTAYDALGAVQAGMGIGLGDVTGDGTLDLFVTNFENESNALYEQQSGELYRETSRPRGLAAESIPWVGWGAALEDFDLDGWLDVIVTNGHVDNNRHLLNQDSPYEQPGLLWRNVSGQMRQVARRAGDYFQRNHVGRGLACADLDNDGDWDVIISHQDELPALLCNQIGDRQPEGRSIMARFVGTSSNRDAVGAVLTFRCAARSFVFAVKGGGSYLSASDPRICFAAGDAAGPWSVEVRWPGGSRETFEPLTAGNEYVMVQGRAFPQSIFQYQETAR